MNITHSSKRHTPPIRCKRPPIIFALIASFLFSTSAVAEIFLGQGTMSGEVSETSIFLQTRLTADTELDAQGDLPGMNGVVCFEWSTNENLSNSIRTSFLTAVAEHDFIVRDQLTGLQPNTKYFYRAVYGTITDATTNGPTCSFKTLPGVASDDQVRFIVGSCMNYCKFMYGKAAQAGPSITATAEDKRLGYPAYVAMDKIKPDFFIGTGDAVYYDGAIRDAKTEPQLRKCWHEQFRFPRMINFFGQVPTYWSKDDHDFRFNDSDTASDRLPLPKTGLEIFREQLPIVSAGDTDTPTYRTYRVNKNLQIWMTEGREFRSPNGMDDGPDKSLWGVKQREWLKETLKSSDAKWKILINPTPMVGPDTANKKDNHTSLVGFQHEANDFFDWLRENNITNFMTICGDRHWQYHSIHPSGINEFACGALNDENAQAGIIPGNAKSTDPQGLIKQPFHYPEPSGGFLVVTADDELKIEFFNDEGKPLHQFTK